MIFPFQNDRWSSTLRAWLLRACLRAAVGRGLVCLGAWAPSLVCGGFARKSFLARYTGN